MTTYEVTLLTEKGIIKIIVTPENIEEKQTEVLNKYGNFTTIKSIEI